MPILQASRTRRRAPAPAAAPWSVRIPDGGFMLALARERDAGNDVLWTRGLGAGRIIVFAVGTLFSDNALPLADNAQLFANLVAASVARAGAVIFDDYHQGLSAIYDPQKFYRDPRLYLTSAILLGLWFIWVLGATRLKIPVTRIAAPRELDLVRANAGFLARVLPPAVAARRLFEHFLQHVGRRMPAGASRRAMGIFASRGARSAGGARATAALACPGLGRQARSAPAALQSHAENRATHRMSQNIRQLEIELNRELGGVIVGAESSIRALVIALLARGHVLVQGVPGLGKTLLAKCLAQALGGQFKRIQGTSDLMPSDIIGVHVFDERERSFVFRPGPLFADVVLVDEINRAGPKTQSALLEAMEERQVSVERSVFTLPEDFMVLATQNPREFEGTYPLPESQLDRFMLRIDVDYPERAAELRVLERYGGGAPSAPTVDALAPLGRGAARCRAQRVGTGSCGGRAASLRTRSCSCFAHPYAIIARPLNARRACVAACGAHRRGTAGRAVRNSR